MNIRKLSAFQNPLSAKSTRVVLAIFFCVLQQNALCAEGLKTTSSFSADLLKTVVSIEQLQNSTNASPLGTGFLLASPKNHLILITAKHVITDDQGKLRENLAIRLNNRTNESELLSDLQATSLIGGWVFSSNADLACRLITYATESDILVVPMDKLLSQTNLSVATPILVLGFPLGIRSTTYAAPIARHGMVARSGDGELILDAFVFPGNSGSPVIYVPPIKIDSNALIKSPFVNEERIIGVVTDYIPYTDTAVSPQTKRARVAFEENTGLCHAVPADKIIELLSRPEFRRLDGQIK